ncbi:hypothetical protein N7457_006435 [Penicillium paradoxum]|uniref:uncharacterized protein n=1 Tax=Penicillium paradoxum TaxID=176176 RepID=UPI00254731FD|nr:uncharacterized protein N7457_006435 [Penicillium paradoxum]KAJ5781275.1 hypothetical protein N7457_006435 [Penicillium paradoxum]
MAPSTELMEITEPTALFEPTAVAEPTMDIGSTAATDTSMATDTTETAEPAASTEKFRKRDKKPELSQVQRASIIQALANGEPVAKIAKDFGIARTTVYHTKKRFRERGDLASQPRTGRPAKRLKHFMAMHDYQPPRWLELRLSMEGSRSRHQSVLHVARVLKRIATPRIPLLQRWRNLARRQILVRWTPDCDSSGCLLFKINVSSVRANSNIPRKLKQQLSYFFV